MEPISQEKQKEFLEKYEKLSKEYGFTLICLSYIKKDGGIGVRLGLALREDKNT